MRETWRLALFGGATAHPNWLFWLDFVVYPPLIAGLSAAYCGSWPAAALVMAGFWLFTFIEYWMHRIPMHRALYHGRHERHHTHPREYVVFPIYYTPVMFAGFYLVLPPAVFVGFLAGYLWFIAWHHLLHHIDLNAYPGFVRRYALWHLAHHHDESCNFGITTNLWDWLFGTYRKSPLSH